MAATTTVVKREVDADARQWQQEDEEQPVSREQYDRFLLENYNTRPVSSPAASSSSAPVPSTKKRKKAAPKRRAAPAVRRQQQPVGGEEDEDERGEWCGDSGEDPDDAQLPMPHPGGGGAPPSDEPNYRAVANPMWTGLFKLFNAELEDELHCWGCTRGMLNVDRLPYEEYSHLVNDLHPRIIEFGLISATRWAGAYFRDSIVGNIDILPSERAEIKWSGPMIVYHFLKHTHIGQYRQLCDVLEMQYIVDHISMRQTFSSSAFAPAGEEMVDASALKSLTIAKAMLDRSKRVDVKKTNTYHPQLACDSASMKPLLQRHRFTGRGILWK